jgi:hypothetical protein
MTPDVKQLQEVKKNAQLCADQGWRGNFFLKSGESIQEAFITKADWDKDAIVLERMGERHVPPRLLMLNEIKKVEVDWSGK